MEPLTLTQCLTDFFERYPQSRGDDSLIRRQLAEYVGADYQTFMRWCKHGGHPTAERRWRMIIFFHITGYSVAEYQAWSPTLQQAAWLLALDVVSVDSLAKACSYTGSDVASSLHKLLGGKRNISKQKLAHLQQFIAAHDAQRKAAEIVFRERFLAVTVPTARTDVADQVQPKELPATPDVLQLPQREPVTLKMDAAHAVQQLAMLVQLSIPYAQYLNSDACTPEDRASLREKTGGKGVFKLNNQLTLLCGERARNQMRNQRG